MVVHGLLIAMASLVVEHSSRTARLPSKALKCSFLVACGMFVPYPGIKPVFPALQGRSLTTESPRKSLQDCLLRSRWV